MWNLPRRFGRAISQRDSKRQKVIMQARLRDWLERPIVRNGIIAVILFNAVILGLETSEPAMAS